MLCRHLKLTSQLSIRLVLASVMTGFLALSAGAAPQQTFGRLFADLPPYEAPDDATLDLLTAAQTTDANGRVVDGPMFDNPTINDNNNPAEVPAFFTYFGQFLDHDMTLDSLPLPVDTVDPSTIPNDRDQRLNLDSVYGTRKNPNPALYEADGKRLKTNGLDLPRTDRGVAIIGDPRNDENQIIAQIHVAYLRAHNQLIDEGLSFADARQLMEWRHQWIVVHEFLPEVLDPDVYNDVFRVNKNQGHVVQIHNRYYDPGSAVTADMPVEFSVGAYRFGHSQVRNAYRISSGGGFIQVFNPATDDLHGGRPIVSEPIDHIIFWPNFINVDGVPPTGGISPVTGKPRPSNIARKIDTLLSPGLFNLPIPGAEASGTAILAKRNIQRAREYGLPSGQAVAKRLRLTALTNKQIADAIPGMALAGLTDDVNGPYKGEAPLWLYILAESKIVHNGAKLGPVGSRIVAEVIGGLLAADSTSYIRRGYVPKNGSYRVQDLLDDAGVLP